MHVRSWFFVALAALAFARAGQAQTCTPVPTALVLSGGGAKGLAHIGILRVLDSLNVRPDLIVGTSMGAIVGAMYASGYSAAQIDSLARQLRVADIVRPFRVPAPHPWDARIPLLFMVKGRRGFEFQTGIVDEAQPNARLNTAMLRGNLLARGQFDRLPIRFRAVATDLRDRSTVVIGDGDLARAVRASSAIPLVFPPVVVDGAVLVDGGLSANIPVAQARQAGARRFIVSDVTEHPEDSLDVESPLALADQLLGFLFHQPASALSADDVFVRPDVQEFGSLDFSRRSVEEILRRGQQAADTTVARARCLTVGPQRRDQSLPGVLRGWRTTNGSAADSVLIGRMLGLRPGDPLDPGELGERLSRTAEAEAFRGIWLNPSGSGDTVSFRFEPIRAPRTVGGAGLAYDQELGGQAWLGLFGRRLLGTPLEGSALLSLGRFRRELYGATLWHLESGASGLAPFSGLRLRRVDIRQFDLDGTELPERETSDAHLSLGLDVRTAEAWRIRLAGDVVTWGSDVTRGRTAVGGSIRFTRQALEGPQVLADAIATDGFRSAHVETRWPIRRSPWSLVPAARVGWGSDLPLQWTFPLGGDEGFPGLHIGERRGSREVAASFRAGFAIKGPLELRLLVATGRAWTPGGIEQSWLAGARFGLGAETPVGPMDLAYGVASNGRGSLYLRLGNWF